MSYGILGGHLLSTLLKRVDLTACCPWLRQKHFDLDSDQTLHPRNFPDGPGARTPVRIGAYCIRIKPYAALQFPASSSWHAQQTHAAVTKFSHGSPFLINTASF